MSKGWCILFGSLLSSEWSRYCILAVMFYCTEGVLIVVLSVDLHVDLQRGEVESPVLPRSLHPGVRRDDRGDVPHSEL